MFGARLVKQVGLHTEVLQEYARSHDLARSTFSHISGTGLRLQLPTLT